MTSKFFEDKIPVRRTQAFGPGRYCGELLKSDQLLDPRILGIVIQAAQSREAEVIS
ncbi:MAG: hypothetical protein ACI9QL_002401 [Candidatus Omnitrophota bacterium]